MRQKYDTVCVCVCVCDVISVRITCVKRQTNKQNSTYRLCVPSRRPVYVAYMCVLSVCLSVRVTV